MNKFLAAVCSTALAAGSAAAGGLDRSGQPISPLFEPGSYAEFSLVHVAPSVSGVGAGAAVSAVTPSPGQGSGDMTGSYTAIGFALKHSYNDRFSVALIHDQPFGANVAYPVATTYFARGSTALLNTDAFTGLVRYKFTPNLSVHAGARYEMVSATATIPFVTAVPGVTAPYMITATNSGGVGFVAGAAFEIPKYAMRVAVTYNSAITHNVNVIESSVLGAGRTSVSRVQFPQSVNLDFQTGLNQKTLLFGSARWVNWQGFAINLADYGTLTGGGSLVTYSSDSISYTLGVGRKLTDTLSAAVTVGYEGPMGGFSPNLGPTDGYTSIGLGLSHDDGKMKISGGVRYVMVGDAVTTLGGGATAANFTGNSALAVGVKVGFRF